MQSVKHRMKSSSDKISLLESQAESSSPLSTSAAADSKAALAAGSTTESATSAFSSSSANQGEGYESGGDGGAGKGRTALSGVTMAVNAMAAQYSSLYSLLTALAYGVCSLLMVFINKALLMQYKYSMTLLACQMITTAAIIISLRRFRVMDIKPLNTATARALFPLSIFYNANVAFALASLKGVNIPMYIALKRLTPMAVLITGFFVGKSPPPLQVTLSVLTTVIGCLIAALGDFSFDPYGYSMALASVGSQTGYLVLVEKNGAEEGLSSFELMLYNSVLSLPFLLAIIVFSGELAISLPLLLEMSLSSASFGGMVIVSLFMGILLNYTMFLCTIVNSALTTTIVGVLKGVFTTFFGFFVLGGVKVGALNITGLVINSAGGVWYSFAKYFQKAAKKDQAKLKECEPLLPTTVIDTQASR